MNTYAETITWAFGGDYWRVSPARYELSIFKDPVWEKVIDDYSGDEIIGQYAVNSAILPITELSWNLKQLYKDSQNNIQRNAEYMWWYELSTYVKSEKEIDTIISNIKKWIINDNTIRFLDAWINSSYIDISSGTKESRFKVWQWGEVVASYKIDDGSIVWIQKLYGGDSPAYYLHKMKIISDKILFQQTELVPYSILYKWGLNQKTFDANLKLAISKGFAFKTESMNKRYKSIWVYFKIHETKLTKTFKNQELSKNYKIENNIVKFLSTGVGDNQYLITDIDPNTVKISKNWFSWVDKDGPFVLWMRLLWWDKNYYSLFKSSADYWGRIGADTVYSYSNNNDGRLVEVSWASIKTIRFIGYTNFDDKKSICTQTLKWAYGYEAFDDKYCYGKPSAQDAVTKVWTLKNTTNNISSVWLTVSQVEENWNIAIIVKNSSGKILYKSFFLTSYGLDNTKKYFFECEESWESDGKVNILDTTTFKLVKNLNQEKKLITQCGQYNKTTNSFNYTLSDSWEGSGKKYLYKFQ